MVPLWYHHISIYRLSRYTFKDFRRTTEPRSLELLPLQGGEAGGTQVKPRYYPSADSKQTACGIYFFNTTTIIRYPASLH